MNIFAIAFVMGAALTTSSPLLSKHRTLRLSSEAPIAISDQNSDRSLAKDSGSIMAAINAVQLQGMVSPLLVADKWEASLVEERIIVSQKIAEDEMKLLEISVVETSPGKKAIEMSNIDSLMFPDFKNNHALYSHGISREDTEEKIKTFISGKLKEFKKSIALSTARSVKSICEDLKSLAASQSGLQVTLKQPKDHFCIIEVSRSKSDKKAALNPVVGHIRVHNINKEMAGINFVQIDREYEARVPKHNYDDNVAEVKNVIKQILGQKENLPITIQKAVNGISDILGSYCGGKKPVLVNLIQEGEIFGGTLDLNLKCDFAGTKIFVEQFNYGYLQYVHIIGDHKLLRVEYMVGIDPKLFDNNLMVVLKGFDSEIKEVLNLQKKSDKENFKITLEEIKKTLAEVMSGYEVVLDNEIVSVKKDNVEYCNSSKSKTESNFSVNFITPGKSRSDVTTNPSLIVTEENGFDQLQRIKAHAESFLNDIAKR